MTWRVAPKADLQIRISVDRELLTDLEWAYPPADAIRNVVTDKHSWLRPARCPNCYAEWTPARTHYPDCRLKEAID